MLSVALICPNCHERGFGIKSKKVKTYHYDYFGHKVKKPNDRWRTKWCYFGKPNSQSELGHNQSDPGVIELGNKLGHTIGITPNPTKIEFMPSLSRSHDLLSNPANLSSSFHNVIPFNLGKITGPEGFGALLVLRMGIKWSPTTTEQSAHPIARK